MSWLRISFLVCALLMTVSLLPCGESLAEDAPKPSSPLRVMSFNIRYGTAHDGENHWSTRREMLVDTIRAFAPDVLGTQEMLRFQAEYIAQLLPQYRYVGQSREPDKPGEECGIFFRGDRFYNLEQGHFWLSETPDQPGSKSWDSSLPRMATWLKLYDREARRTTYILNTHFDHIGQEARDRSARLIRNRLEKLGAGETIVVTGDFNTAALSQPHSTLAATTDALTLVDSFHALHPSQVENTGTFHAFQGTRTGDRIDWILCSPQLRVVEAGIDTTCQDNRYPSDHFPVFAVLEWLPDHSTPVPATSR